MKSFRLPLKTLLLLAGTACLFFTTMPKVFASAEDQVDNALNASKSWVSEIDAGKYDESYTFGCDAMHQKVTEERWEQILKALRTPWGPVVSRTQLSHVYKPNGYEGTNGEFLVITYNTAFKKIDAVTEVVVLKWEDGKWVGAGYNAGPKSTDDDTASNSSAPITETHTDAHVKPQPEN